MQQRANLNGFSLVELLLALGVLSLLVVMTAEMVAQSASLTSLSARHLEADGRARLIFERLAQDFSGMPRDAGLDALFVNRKSEGGGGGNDLMYFYSHAPGYFGGGEDERSPISLVGYRIKAGGFMERLGKGLGWAGAVTRTRPGSPFFSQIGTIGQPRLNGDSLGKRWIDTIGVPPNYGGSDDNFHVLTNQICRFEFLLQRRDGSWADPDDTQIELGAVVIGLAISEIELSAEITLELEKGLKDSNPLEVAGSELMSGGWQQGLQSEPNSIPQWVRRRIRIYERSFPIEGP